MPKSATVTLDGADYTIRRFNLGELEDLTEALGQPGSKSGFRILRTALARAEPKIENIPGLEIDADEMKAAIEQIMALNGLKAKPKGAPEIAGTETGAAAGEAAAGS